IQSYGIFVDIGAAETGLVHVSRLGSLDVSRVQLGDEVSVKVSAREPKLQLSVPTLDLPRQQFVAPVVVLPTADVGAREEETRLGGSLSALPKPLFARVLLQGLNLADLGHLTHVSRSLRSMAVEASNIFWDVCSLCCFHTRARFDEAECILGVGVAIVEEDGRKHLTCDFDPLSQLAFDKLGVRKGVWRNRISYWLPLAIDSHHFVRAASSLSQVLRVLGTGKVAEATRSWGRKPGIGLADADTAGSTMSFDRWLEEREKKSQAAKAKFEAFRAGNLQVMKEPAKEKPQKPSFDPSIVLEVLPKLMTSQVVLLMKGETWASHKALSGYMGFHHLLLSICHAEPTVQVELERRISQFVANEDQRVKSAVPNLGEFICLLSASQKHSWQSVAGPLLTEVFDRNVLWVLKKYPHLAQLSDAGVSRERLRATFQAALVSMRLIMFNAWFLNKVAKPSADTSDSALARYERTKGVPPRHQIEAVHRAVRTICEVDSWEAYFDSLGVERVKPEQLCNWLRQSVRNSAQKGYHKSWHFRSKAGPAKKEEGWDACDQMAEAYESH
ncbi:UBC5B, partial [Symbiodinium pilosum]